ncbi:MAG TPA: redoxin domain-containing protein [Candidatus Kapabacteria bacterium]
MKQIILSLALFLFTSCNNSRSMDTTKKELSPERAKLAASLEDLKDEHVKMPKLPLAYEASRYINTTSQELQESLKGKVVLIDIWDYTCVNCIRTLPYIQSWAEKYKDKGLVILGVHSPEFAFEKEAGNLEMAVKKFALTYPVIADNEFEIWNSLANKYWPAKYIFDASGTMRAQHYGEGQYQEFEAFIQKLLLERDSTITLPELTPHVRDADKPGAVCYRPTPETYLGFERSNYGNLEKFEPRKPTIFTLPTKLIPDRLYLSGEWKIDRQFAVPTGAGDASLIIDNEAKEVNLVIKPLAEKGFKVLVEQDGKPVAKENRGTDIIEENSNTYVVVSEPRMYNIINNAKFGRSSLKLTSSSTSFGAFAYTFTRDCKELE